VTLSYHGSCLNDASLSPPDPEIITKDAFKPIIRNPIDRINVTAGELLRLKVPEVFHISFLKSHLKTGYIIYTIKPHALKGHMLGRRRWNNPKTQVATVNHCS